jgi:hypothetical protein
MTTDLDSPAGKRQLVISALGATLLPALALSLYLIIGRASGNRHMEFDAAAVIVSAVLGCGTLAFLPVALWIRVLLIPVYAVLAYYALPYYELLFVCVAFRDCL